MVRGLCFPLTNKIVWGSPIGMSEKETAVRVQLVLELGT